LFRLSFIANAIAAAADLNPVLQAAGASLCVARMREDKHVDVNVVDGDEKGSGSEEKQRVAWDAPPASGSSTGTQSHTAHSAHTRMHRIWHTLTLVKFLFSAFGSFSRPPRPFSIHSARHNV
jgi:hypothetical protein